MGLLALRLVAQAGIVMIICVLSKLIGYLLSFRYKWLIRYLRLLIYSYKVVYNLPDLLLLCLFFIYFFNFHLVAVVILLLLLPLLLFLEFSLVTPFFSSSFAANCSTIYYFCKTLLSCSDTILSCFSIFLPFPELVLLLKSWCFWSYSLASLLFSSLLC